MMGARLGVFGGTFDPIHHGHLILAEEVRHVLALDRVLFVPAGQPPHKRGQPVTDAAHRLAMVRLAISDNPGFALSLLDIERDGPSYTADLLEELARRAPAADLFFIMGADSLEDLPTWHAPGRITRAARLVVVTRPGVTVALDRLARAVPGLQERVVLVPMPAIDIAGRALRQRVAEGRPIRYQTPSSVEAYIAAHGLYRARTADR